MTAAQILLAEDRTATRERLGAALRASGFAVISAGDGAEALARFESNPVDLVLSDFDMPALDGLGLLRRVRRIREVPFILYSAGAAPEVVFRAGRGGALRFLSYPFGVDEQLVPAIHAALAERTRESRPVLRGAERFLGDSAAASRVRSQIRRLGPTAANVLVLGETGAGKEVVAQALHEESGRARMVAFAVTELADSLLEAELFGAERGAYTGAHQARPGLLAQAHGGTLFLDEIGDASPRLQAKLLRALESGELRRVGGGQLHRVELRVVAATHCDPAALMRTGHFRHDLYYRIAQATIPVPPLRDRPTDVDVLAQHFLADAAGRIDLAAVPSATPAFFAALRADTWPGNARELRAALQSVLLWWDRVSPLEAVDLLAALATMRPALRPGEQALCQRMVEALQAADGNQEAARRMLGMTRSAWRHRWRRFGLAGHSGGSE